MKRILLYFVVGISISCGGRGNNTGETTTDSASTVSSLGGDAAVVGAKLISASDCRACHTEKETIIGPAYLQIAEKYPKNDSTTSFLATKIIAGGSGNWGSTPMPPHPQHSYEEAVKMARYILSLKN